MKRYILLTAIAVVWLPGCSQAPKPTDAATLDEAYRSGVLSREEYEAKKARLTANAEKLDALEKARSAGVLTADEYQVKKSQLLGGTLAAATAPQTPQQAPEPIAASPQLQQQAPAAQQLAAQQPATMVQNSQPAQPAPLVQQTAAAAPQITPAAPVPRQQDAGHTFRMKKVAAIDQSGFERPMPSLTMLVPVDWQPQGGTNWNIKDKCNTLQTNFRATAPDGRSIEFFPVFNWMWADDPQPLKMTAAQTAQYGQRPCDVMPPMSAADFARNNLRRYRPNAQLMGIEPAPKVLASFQEQARQGERAAQQYNLKQRIKPDAVRARVRYNVNGQPMEEWIVVATVITGTLGPSYNMRTMQMGQAYTYNCAAYVTGLRTPQGQLEASEKLFELIISTSRVNPQWQAKVNGNAQAIQAIELKGVRDRSAIISKNADDISKIRRETYENQQRSQDRISLQRSQATLGIETYRNPATGETVDLSNQYGQAWVNNRGEYLLSDQPGFDPSVTFKEDWKRLERVKP